ncbi:hypothetical protein F4861DRAFT_489047 [Xylaria intraflava]|nr:hypothetical protein F4861DRAFT_489047 [Xylaria intraflava]
MAATTSLTTSPSKQNELPFDAETKSKNPLSPTRNGTVARGLSWQRRPVSQHSEERPRSRPLSAVAAENVARSSNPTQEQESVTQESLSRNQIASALSSKDPSWFRQTADRGASSAAYRRNQVEDTETVDPSSAQTQLPGMSRNTSGGSRENADASPESSAPPSTTAPATNLFNGPKLDSPANFTPSDVDSSREPRGTFPPLTRASPTRSDRPVSPTKGMGGFVQSAMLKRSESVSKRWSVQSPPTLQRVDPVTSNRTGTSSNNRPTSLLRGGASTESSRPGSGDGREEDRPVSRASASLGIDADAMVPPESPGQESGKVTPPVSPSKTMDPRRWSPQKSSWLESALNKPESPKSKPAQPPSNQPAWMAELQKAKAQKAAHPGTDSNKPPVVSHKHQVSIGGLMRSSAPGINTVPVGRGALHSPSQPTTSASASVPHLKSDESKPSTVPSLAKVKSEPTGDGKSTGSLPAVNKAKPATPPKKDFRANLRPSAPTGTTSTSQNVEFKNVFGNLRKTTTQNYVAPDELKNNITRGKAALTVTGGPQKSERVDEFKEAIMAKKKEFHAAHPEGWKAPRNNSVSSEQLIPEGILKRSELGRSNTTKRDSAPSDVSKPEARRPSIVTPRDSVGGGLSERLERFGNLEKHGSTARSSNPKFEAQGTLPETSIIPGAPISKRGSVSTDRVIKTNSPPRLPRLGSMSTDRVNETNKSPRISRPPSMSTDRVNETNSPPRITRPVGTPTDRDNETNNPSRPSRPVSMSTDRVNEINNLPHLSRPASMSADRINEPRLPGKLGGSALANRFNPALSSLIARGPPSTTSNTSTNTGRMVQSSSISKAESDENESGSGPKLTHMTKNRARGPKRKAPTKTLAPSTIGEDPKPGPTIDSLNESAAPAPVPAQPRPKPIALAGTLKLGTEMAATAEPSTTPPKSESRIHQHVTGLAAQGPQSISTKKADEPQQTMPLSSSPRKLNMNRMSRFMDGAPIDDDEKRVEQPKAFDTPVKTRQPVDKTSTQDVQSKPKPRSPSINKPKMPSPGPISPASKRPPAKIESTDAKSESKANTPVTRSPPRSMVPPANETLNLPARPLPERPLPEKPLPEKPARGSLPREIKSPSIAASPMGSPNKQSPDISVVLQDFFGSDRPQRNYRVDAAELLMQGPTVAPSKTWTISAQLFLFSAGRKQLVPAHHERTLFERELYLCAHSFKNEVGETKAEVYFWIGDEVPESTIEDAAVFAAREARSFGGTLVKLRQGKETPGFLQALGGIVITQRGSANVYDSLAPRMLCGRRHYGQVVFDEVDFTPSALCSGFSYLLTQGGRCCLWKGKGSNIDELSCARLVGTDYALSGEMEEVEEGLEPSSFWALFDGANRSGSADHWRLKPNYDKYRSRLFLSDAASKQQIVELSMFTQADLLPTRIYIIDAFFELYIVVGARAQSQYTSFHNALDFAQEYAILAAGIEDRPFVPVSTVVLEGVPRDMKSVFRKWQDALSPTITNANVGLRRGRSLKIVPLSQALQALSN